MDTIVKIKMKINMNFFCGKLRGCFLFNVFNNKYK